MDDTIKMSIVSGDMLEIALTHEGDGAHSYLVINGVRYHFERVTKSDLLAEYKVDDDPEYSPQSDSNGHCYILAPYSE